MKHRICKDCGETLDAGEKCYCWKDRENLIKVTKERWDAIHSDYKTDIKGQPRKVLLGCIQKNGGTGLVTEGVHFEIVG